MCFSIEEIQEDVFGESSYDDEYCVQLLNEPSAHCQQPEGNPLIDALILERANIGIHSTMHWREL